MIPDLAKKYAAPVPRYTSYPTAPHFSAAIGPDRYAGWLGALDPRSPLSLYLHIPFCNALCWYCGCTTKVANRYDAIAHYVSAILTEIETVSQQFPARMEVSHIHFGGGSPSILSPQDIRRVGQKLDALFDIRPNVEFGIEIDPRFIDDERVEAFADIGVNRLSCGVQDFNDDVQAAINRHQSFEQTESAIRAFRDAGVTSVNIDLVYGLPKQTRDSVDATIGKVISLAPDRIALFGYAHLPQRIRHQRLINDEDLPKAKERFAQSNRAASRLTEAGYVRIGLDHFAKPHDSLVAHHEKRNFQGYSSDDADTLIGFGASAIGQLPQGYTQNIVSTMDYTRTVLDGDLATARGLALSDEDRARAYMINSLMCQLRLDRADFLSRHKTLAQSLIDEADGLAEADPDGLFVATDTGYEVTERGRPFLRSICSCFDAYLGESQATHAAGV